MMNIQLYEIRDTGLVYVLFQLKDMIVVLNDIILYIIL